MEQEKRVCYDCGCEIEDREGVQIGGEWFCKNCADEWTECANCGELIRIEDAHTTPDGDYYCDSCADDYLYYCDRCGDVVWADDIIQVARDSYSRRRGDVEYCCRDCAERIATQCKNCGEWYTDGVTETRDGARCEDCLEDYCYCEECGEYVHYDDYDSEAEMCCRCAEESGYNGLIKGYHDRPSLHYYGEQPKQWRGIWRGIGVELEIDRDDHDSEAEADCAAQIKEIAGDHVYFNRDGSLDNGFEIITQPHTEAAFWAMGWDRILQTCLDNDYRSHDAGTCGLHLHISREMFGANEKRQGIAISKLIRFYDLYFADILKISRRTAEQADRWAAAYNTRDRKEAEHFGKIKGATGRYFAVNNTNRATVEIRITRGTLNYNTFRACIDFMMTVAKNSRRIAWANISNVAEWLKGIKPETADYVRARGAFAEVM